MLDYGAECAANLPGGYGQSRLGKTGTPLLGAERQAAKQLPFYKLKRELQEKLWRLTEIIGD